MKTTIIMAALFAATLTVSNVQAQTNIDPNAPVMKFEKDTIDYGTIEYGADGVRYFTFTNTGNEPLVIVEAHGSCGCTVPTPPKEPIQPGQTAKIKVEYNTKNGMQAFLKSVTITSNANPSTRMVYIKGTVLPKPTEISTAGTK